LFFNAVNYDIERAKIIITMREGMLKICNTGENNLLTDETIFNRFVRSNQKSFGLGLAIVKKICETNHLDIHYDKGSLHCFILQPK